MAIIHRLPVAIPVVLSLLSGCKPAKPMPAPESKPSEDQASSFQWTTGDRFGDSEILRYQVPGFEDLDLGKKKLLYYLSKAALSGRDIIYDQNYRFNLVIRKTLEAIVGGGHLDRSSEEGKSLLEYAKKVWFANGIHHHYSQDKFSPGFSPAFFAEEVKALPESSLPLLDGETIDDLLAKLHRPIFDPKFDAKKVELSAERDPVRDSANNFYAPGVTAQEVEAFYQAMQDPKDSTPISYGLNTKVVRVNGKLKEVVWKVDGMYGAAIREIVKWLEKAVGVAENETQKGVLEALIRYYRSGDLADFDTYNIKWVADTNSVVDVVNGFIEVYGDAMAYKATYESVVSFRDPVATKRIATLAREAQWFEEHAPYFEKHKKDKVKGISAKVITVVQEAGDAAPSTPIGINLPNADWIRANHGSKSVSLGNIIRAYSEAKKEAGTLREFCFDETIAKRLETLGPIAFDLEVDLHEVIGHASGKLEAGVATPKETLKTYASTLEEARADLVALYFVADAKLQSLGLASGPDIGKAAYDGYIQNGLMKQLNRIKLGNTLEEAHMRNRQLIAMWAYEKGKAENVIEKKKRDGKTFVVINDYEKLRELFGSLLREVQRIKSQGDYKAGKALVEDYGVQIDRELHEEVLARYARLNVASYYGFIQPELVPVMKEGEIVDIKVTYPEDFTAQQLAFGEKYGFLPVAN